LVTAAAVISFIRQGALLCFLLLSAAKEKQEAPPNKKTSMVIITQSINPRLLSAQAI